MFLAIFKQMLALGRHPRTFARIDRRNQRSLALCDRVGLAEERPDPHSDLPGGSFAISPGVSIRCLCVW